MNPNNSLSYEDNSTHKNYSDQFMPSMPKTNAGPSFQNFMQACFTNPSFFESMRSYYVSQTHKPAGENLSASYQGLNLQPYQQSQPNLTNQSRHQIKYESDSRSQQFQRESEVPKGNQMKRKPANPLSKYFPAESTSSERANEPLSKATTPAPLKPSFQQRPIKSSYTIALNNNSQAFDLNTIKENQSINIENPKKKVKNFDDEPIRGMKQNQIQNYFIQPQQKNKSGVTSFEDQRPIKGLAKDFKEAIKQQFPHSMMDRPENSYKEEDSENFKPEPRAFLKRGSRHNLSSAMNKSKQPKNNLDKSLNKSQIEDPSQNRSITPKRMQPQTRTISQNKVLSKKNNQPEKSTSKLPTKKNDFSDQQLPKSKPILNKQRPPKPQVKSTKTFEKAQPKEMSTKNIKKKNVFNDDSESSSSSEQEVSPTFKSKNNTQINTYKNVKVEDYENKIEVIEGVYLSQQQLDEIISIYGKAKEKPKESESEKVAALRRKYNEMIALKDEQMEKFKQQLEKQREQFEKYKADQLTKLKNEKRIMERQVKGGMGSQNLQKEKEELQNLKQQLQKQKEDFKRKDKNNKIIIDKYKKENEQLKSKVEKLQNELTSNRRQVTQTNRAEDNYLEQKTVSTKSINGSVKSKKAEEQSKVEEISYKDLKKTNKPPIQDNKETKSKYQYVQEDTFSKNKSFSSKQEKKEPKIQNKWASHKFTNSDDSASEHQDEDEEKITQNTKGNDWSPAMKLSDLTKTSLSIKMVNDQMIDSLFRFQKNMEYLRYMQSTKLPTRTVVNTTRNNANSYTTKIYSDRTKQLVYDNGTRKVACQNGYSIVYFKNGDIKQTLPDKTVLYYFKQKEVDQITLSNGINIYRFENNQVEFHFQNGYIQIRHPDGTIKVLGDHVRR